MPDHTPAVRFWDGIAESYAAKPVEDPAAFERKIAITRGLMKPDDVVLDVGCGTGSLALRLASAGGHVHGLDVSKEMIRIARAKAAAEGAANVTFHVGAVESLDAFEDESLDGLCAYSLLHLVPDRAAVLQAIRRRLKPGGFFVSSTVCLGDEWVPYRPLLWAMRLVGKAPYVAILAGRTLEADLEAAGFEELERPDVGAKPSVSFVTCRKPARG